jgi:hypothetical protein
LGTAALGQNTATLAVAANNTMARTPFGGGGQPALAPTAARVPGGEGQQPASMAQSRTRDEVGGRRVRSVVRGRGPHSSTPASVSGTGGLGQLQSPTQVSVSALRTAQVGGGTTLGAGGGGGVGGPNPILPQVQLQQQQLLLQLLQMQHQAQGAQQGLASSPVAGNGARTPANSGAATHGVTFAPAPAATVAQGAQQPGAAGAVRGERWQCGGCLGLADARGRLRPSTCGRKQDILEVLGQFALKPVI